MKTDWSQMAGEWVYVDERLPPHPGEYFVLTTKLNELPMKYNPSGPLPRWQLKHMDDWVVAWFEVPFGKTETLFLKNKE